MLSGVSGVSVEFDPSRSSKPALAFLKDYWDAKRGQRAMPSRAGINPAEMKQHIRAIVLVDALPGYADFRYRMIGSDVTEYMLGDATGKTVREAMVRFGEEHGAGAVAAYAHMAQNRLVMRLYGSAAWLGHPHLDFDSIHLPLSDDGEHVNMIISAVVFEPAAGLKG
ncbi:MAG: PAS domain-containing protein [Proteobacteria bacterium]|nr:PAS domain-containing protein [Pseudomonadota bacterium]